MRSVRPINSIRLVLACALSAVFAVAGAACLPNPASSCGTTAGFDQVSCGGGDYCPSNSTCGSGICYCDTGYTAVDCSGNACNGNCPAPNWYCKQGSTTNQCPASTPLYCTAQGWCCPYGNNGNKNVCCASGCTATGTC